MEVMAMNRTRLHASRILLTATLLACMAALGAERVINDRPDQVTNPVQMGEVVFLDHALNRVETRRRLFGTRRDTAIRVSVVEAGIQRQASGYQRVTALFRNHTDYPQVIEVRAQFFDEQRALTEDFTRWQRIMLPANAVENYAANSIDPATRQYRLEVRETQ
jgi:hypothetical protein